MTPEQLSDLQELIDKFHPSSISEAELKRRCKKTMNLFYAANMLFDGDTSGVYHILKNNNSTFLDKLKEMTTPVQQNNTFTDNEQK